MASAQPNQLAARRPRSQLNPDHCRRRKPNAVASNGSDTKTFAPIIVAGCSLFSGIGVVLLAFWRLQASRSRVEIISHPPAGCLFQKERSLPPELAPQLAEMLKSVVVVQELASQRRELPSGPATGRCGGCASDAPAE